MSEVKKKYVGLVVVIMVMMGEVGKSLMRYRVWSGAGRRGSLQVQCWGL